MPDAADPRPLALVSDFDGTIAQADVGDAICERAIPEAFAEFMRDWTAGRVTLLEGQRRIWPRLERTEAELGSIVDEVATLRSGFARVVAAAAARGVPVAIASNGFANYIERTLMRAEVEFPEGPPPQDIVAALQAPARATGRRPGVRAILANRLAFDGRRVTPEFPLEGRFGCGSCGVCKGRIIDLLRAAGFRVAFAGDGSSDRCAAGRADHLFAVRGASLERYCRERGVACIAFERFEEVGLALGLLPEQVGAGGGPPSPADERAPP